MNRKPRIVITILLLLALGGIHQSLMAQTPQLSVMELPAVEGSDGPQVAVKWSGRLPVTVQAGVEASDGEFLASAAPIELIETMTLLPNPAPKTGRASVWRVVKGKAQTLSTTTTTGIPEFEWKQEFHNRGLSGSVNAVAEYQGNVIVAGDFLSVDDQLVNRIATWDGSSWSALGGPVSVGVNGPVRALIVNQGELIAGGTFTEAGGQVVNNVARWDGSEWRALSGSSSDGVDGTVSALAEYGGGLIAGGGFTNAGGMAADRIARWDGANWSALSAAAINGFVSSLTVWGDNLIVAGSFTTVDTLTVNRIALWNGSSWSALTGSSGTGLDRPVEALGVYDGSLVVGGNFNSAGGVPATRIARWDGSEWSALAGPSGVGLGGSNFFYRVNSLTEFNGDLIVGGFFSTAENLEVNNIARWNGSAWSSLPGASGVGVGGRVGSMIVRDNTLIVGGGFTIAGGDEVVNHLGRWNGTDWESVVDISGNGLNGSVLALAVYDNSLIVGGEFTGAGSTRLDFIGRWDGSSWSKLSDEPQGDLDGIVRSVAVYEGALHVGGDFLTAGGTVVNRIARWDGATWSALSMASGIGVNNSVYGLYVHDGALIAAGRFFSAGGVDDTHGVAAWDGAEWFSLVSRPAFYLEDVIIFQDTLIVGGHFTVNYSGDGFGDLRGIMQWTGTQWAPLVGPDGEQIDGGVSDLALFNGELVVAGTFSQVGDLELNGVGRWSGNEWLAMTDDMGTGVNGRVDALAGQDGALIVGGTFSEAAGRQANNVAKWDGESWSVMSGPNGTGVNDSVSALTSIGDELFAGGEFTLAGGNLNWRLGRYAIATLLIGGDVSELEGSGLVLQNNGGDDLAVNSNGSFVFPNALEDTSSYEVTVFSQPIDPSQTCTVLNGIGKLAGVDVVDVEVTCVTDQFTVGGTVSDLAGSGLVLQNNGGDDLPIAADGSFTFPTALDDLSGYAVTVFTQPDTPSQTCTVSNGAGDLAGAEVTDVDVTCATDSYTVTTTATNGSITSAIDPVVEWGQTTVVTGQADANHYFASVDGCNGTQQTNSDQSITEFSYETGAIEADCTVSAEFSIRTYTMSSTVSSGQGTIDVLTPVVEHGSDADFEVTPDAGWSLQSFAGDTCTPSDNGDGTWTATAISSDCEVTAEFIKNTAAILTTSMTPAIVGMPVTYTISVIGTASAPVDGQVELVSDFNGVICNLASADSTSGQTAVFSCQHTWSEPGEHQLTAAFSGSESHGESIDSESYLVVEGEDIFTDRFEQSVSQPSKEKCYVEDYCTE